MAYTSDPSMADNASPRDAIARALMNITDPPPGGIHAPVGGLPPAQQAPGQATPQVGGAMGLQPPAPVGGMAGAMPGMQPAALGTAAPPGGPMGPIPGPYSSQLRLPGVTPRY